MLRCAKLNLCNAELLESKTKWIGRECKLLGMRLCKLQNQVLRVQCKPSPIIDIAVEPSFCNEKSAFVHQIAWIFTIEKKIINTISSEETIKDAREPVRAHISIHSLDAPSDWVTFTHTQHWAAKCWVMLNWCGVTRYADASSRVCVCQIE